MFFRKKNNFFQSYEMSGVPPLSHEYEEIRAYTHNFKEIGLYADKYYLYYSIDGFGKSFNEQAEIEKSQKSIYQKYHSLDGFNRYLRGSAEIVERIGQFITNLEKMDIEMLSLQECKDHLIEACELDEWASSYFLITQYPRLNQFDKELRSFLERRVARQRIDQYLTVLASSDKPTKLSFEELDWLNIVKLAGNKKIAQIKSSKLEKSNPEIYDRIAKHFEKYKLLPLGDGKWRITIDYYIEILYRDIKKDIDGINERIKELEDYSKNIKNERDKIIKDLEIPSDLVKIADLVAEFGVDSFKLRIDGWVPIIPAIQLLSTEMSKRLNIEGIDLFFTTIEEFKSILAGKSKLTPADLKKRKGAHEEYLQWVDNGKLKLLFGEEARKKFHQLVPPKDYSKNVEIKGNIAQAGKVEGRVCLYNWGDDIEEKLKTIKTNKILVAGHTRPAMMPLIREAIGIVTDEGGITSHAAIVARELGLPSVINTREATKVFKEGDMVELDAYNGVVRKI